MGGAAVNGRRDLTYKQKCYIFRHRMERHVFAWRAFAVCEAKNWRLKNGDWKVQIADGQSVNARSILRGFSSRFAASRLFSHSEAPPGATEQCCEKWCIGL